MVRMPDQEPLGLVGDGFAGPSVWIGGLAFVAAMALLYRWAARLAR